MGSKPKPPPPPPPPPAPAPPPTPTASAPIRKAQAPSRRLSFASFFRGFGRGRSKGSRSTRTEGRDTLGGGSGLS